MNTDELAKAKGLQVYDTALPQDWYDKFYDQTGVNPSGLFVWSYDQYKIFGAPVALTEEAQLLLDLVNEGIEKGREPMKAKALSRLTTHFLDK